MGQRSNRRREDVQRAIRMVSRTHTTEYSSDKLIGNWNKERFDVTKLAQSKCLPSQYSHYFETMYNVQYKNSQNCVNSLTMHFTSKPLWVRRSG